MRLFALALLTALVAPSVQAQSNDSLVVLFVFESRIMFETVIDASGPNPAIVSVTVPAGAPVPRQIGFSRSPRPDRRAMIELRKDADGTYKGSGRLPAPDQIQSVVFVNSKGRIQLEVPSTWEEGVAAVRYRARVDGEMSEGTVNMAYDLNPNELSFNIGMPPSIR